MGKIDSLLKLARPGIIVLLVVVDAYLAKIDAKDALLVLLPITTSAITQWFQLRGRGSSNVGSDK